MEGNTSAAAAARQILECALASVEPSVAVNAFVRLDGNSLIIADTTHDLASIDRIRLIAAGKASVPMTLALEDLLGDRIADGLIITKHGHIPPRARPRSVEVVEASHPIPCEQGVLATERILEIATSCTDRDLLLCAWSGGGSALLTLPAPGISTGDLRDITQMLLTCGATIDELNTVRKHLSQIKGGLLSRAAIPARVESLLISDVVGDRLDTIASGPTSPDPTTFADALGILERFVSLDDVPPAVLDHLRRGADGEVPETPGADDAAFASTSNTIVASNFHCTRAAAERARTLGLKTHVFDQGLQGAAREKGKQIGDALRKIATGGETVPRPSALVYGGETTVVVKGGGTGGRNQELALAAVKSLDGIENACVAAFSTDGQDGPTMAAGALVTGETLRRSTQQGMDVDVYLEDNDSNTFFCQLKDLIITGPTYTNVADLVVAVLL